jgi:Glycosyl hydrolases family 35
MRAAALLLLCSLAMPAPAYAPPAREYVQAVEFPYYLYPRALWERELVWLKAIGIRTVEFSIPPNWHTTSPGQYDFTGETSPRRDLLGLIRILRRLELHAWVRPLPGPAGTPPNFPAPALDVSAQAAWLKQLGEFLATRTANHGGPVAYVEGGVLAIDAATAPVPVASISLTSADALAASRDALGKGKPFGSGALLWRDVEDALYPEGWTTTPVWLRKGAVGLSGDETPATTALRRDAALLRNWGPLLSGLTAVPLPKPAAGKWPEGVTAFEVTSPAASAVSVTNHGKAPFQDDVRVVEPGSKRIFTIPGVTVGPGESLWLPVSVSIGPDGLCSECSHFAGAEHIIYATAELLSIEFENGILAMEFAAPQAAEVVLQFARKPVGPYLAGGKPSEFEWDDKTLRARLNIPAGKDAGHRVRVGIAIEEPETSGFFNEAHRLIIGKANTLSTTYSDPDVARRSRLRLPPGFTAVRKEKTPNEIEYEVSVPGDALHGDWANLALEADGMPLGRARLQLFRPVSIRLADAIVTHFGSQTELTPDPPVTPVEPKGGTNLEVLIRNNAPGIETFHLEASGDGLEFFPAKTEISVGAVDERRLGIRVFAKEDVAGLRDWHLRVSGATDLDLPMRALLVPRGRTVAWTADLDSDGAGEWILETQKVRAVFSSRDGGRWMEFTWKDGNFNFLPDQGTFAGAGPVEIRAEGDALVISGKGWQRTVRLSDTALTIEQSTPLPFDRLTPEHRGSVNFSIDRRSPTTSVYRLN